MVGWQRSAAGVPHLILKTMIVLLIMTSVPLAGCSPAPSPSGGPWVEDIEYLVRELPRRHKNLFFNVTREEFEEAAASLRSSVPDMTDDEIKVALARLVAMVGDAHTSLRLTRWSTGIDFDTFLIEAGWFPEGLFVTWAGAGHDRLFGCRVVGIGEMDVGEAYDMVKELISHENEQWARYLGPEYLLTPEILVALGIAPDGEAVPFTFESPQGDVFTTELTPCSRGRMIGDRWRSCAAFYWGETALYLRNPGDDYWFEYLDDSRTLYVKYDSCRGDLSKTVAGVRHVLDAQPVERLVIDLRHNSGGNSEVINPLVDELKARPSLEGRIYCIIGRQTFSSGVLNAIELKRDLGAILVGEPTGGKPNCYGEVRNLRLPHSGLRVSYSVKYFSPWPEDTPSLMPDIPVEVTAADYFSGRDPVLEAILNLSPEGEG